MQIAAHLDQLAADAVRLRRAADWAGLETAVPSCPGWNLRRLVQHTTKVHHWVSWLLAGKPEDEFVFPSPRDGELLEVFSAGAAKLIVDIRSASPSVNVRTLYPAESGRDFWARRQAHETAIHRADAELAAGYGVTAFDPQFAADGLAELLEDFGPVRVDTRELDRTFSVTFTPIDVNAAWTVSVGPGRFETVRQARDDSDLTVFGMTSDLYRWAWNRAGDDEVSLRGDVELSDVWRRTCAISAR